jgi:hypothetical protein
MIYIVIAIGNAIPEKKKQSYTLQKDRLGCGGNEASQRSAATFQNGIGKQDGTLGQRSRRWVTGDKVDCSWRLHSQLLTLALELHGHPFQFGAAVSKC